MEAATPMATRQQADVLASAAAGDEIAFQHIIAAHHEDLRRVCRAISGDHTIADDATQAAWLVAWKKLHKVHGPEQLRPWLMSVAVHEAKKLMSRRRRRARIEVPADATAEPGGIDPATGVAAVDLRAAISRLDPDDAALLAMRYVAGFDSNELSKATGISPSGTRSRIERALKRLRKDLGDG
jgi:RNA polymerase sigma-70 factor (ECF subfamily)